MLAFIEQCKARLAVEFLGKFDERQVAVRVRVVRGNLETFDLIVTEPEQIGVFLQKLLENLRPSPLGGPGQELPSAGNIRRDLLRNPEVRAVFDL